jgi:hypothetical protein
MSCEPGGENENGGEVGQPQPPRPPYHLYDHAVDQMIERGYNFQDLDAALQNVSSAIAQSNGNVVFVGRNGIGVVVDPDTNEIVTVLRPGMVPIQD